ISTLSILHMANVLGNTHRKILPRECLHLGILQRLGEMAVGKLDISKKSGLELRLPVCQNQNWHTILFHGGGAVCRPAAARNTWRGRCGNRESSSSRTSG